MSADLAVHHGAFGRATLNRLNRPLAPHAHREGHLIFLLEGVPAAIEAEGRRLPLGIGTAAAVSPWEMHRFVPGRRECACLTLYIAPDWYEARHAERRGADRRIGLPHSRHPLVFGRGGIRIDQDIAGLVRAITDDLVIACRRDLEDDQIRLRGRWRGEAHDPLSAVIADHIFDLTRLCEAQSWARTEDEDAPTGLREPMRDYRIRKSVRLMRESLGEEIALDRIAREVGLSRPHFFKLFRTNLGVTPNIYVNALKMERSIERLSTTHETVTSIGLDLGFASQASFTRFFTANSGINPSDYRRRVQT
ncbi:MAG: AraC family transcriptional regulator [Pseudomonadota bacterium]